MVKMDRWKYTPLLVFQGILMILFFSFATYGGAKDANVKGFEDTHVMIFIGFAYLMTFLRKYCYSALGFNWFLAAVVIQWALLCQSFFHMENGTIAITKKSLLEADIMSATVLITFGSMLGLASGTQLFFLAIIEVVFGCVNLWLMEHIYKASDIGGSMAIHTYGAYFGLAASAAFRFKKPEPTAQEQRTKMDEPTYTSDITAMIGSIFLWIFWPSFNSGLAGSDAEQQRAVINTYLSLASATVTTFVISAAVSHEPGKFDMVHVQNSTLAGGVGVGAVANMFISPGGAIAIGIGAGVISVLGYRFVTPFLDRIGIKDTCGVHNLHGAPGVYSGILSIAFAYFATADTYGEDLDNIFEAMAKDGRTASVQSFYQLMALLTTLGIALSAGFLSGLIARRKMFTTLTPEERYDDKVNWVVPDDV